MQSISHAVAALIEMKSKRDNQKFTSYQLAKEIDVDRSLIQRILTQAVENPRVDTLKKIADYFVQQGFPVSLDDMVSWNKKVDVTHTTYHEEKEHEVSLYSMDSTQKNQLAKIKLNLSSFSPGTVGFIAHQPIKPIFTSGSIFIVDMLKSIEEEHMILIRSEKINELQVRKVIQPTSPMMLLNYATGEIAPLKEHDEIIGVVTKINIEGAK